MSQNFKVIFFLKGVCSLTIQNNSFMYVLLLTGKEQNGASNVPLNPASNGIKKLGGLPE